MAKQKKTKQTKDATKNATKGKAKKIIITRAIARVISAVLSNMLCMVVIGISGFDNLWFFLGCFIAYYFVINLRFGSEIAKMFGGVEQQSLKTIEI